MENDDFRPHSSEEEGEEFAKSEIFKRLNQEILLKNHFPEEITQWLYEKCAAVASNMYEGSDLTEEIYQDIFSIFEKQI